MPKITFPYTDQGMCTNFGMSYNYILNTHTCRMKIYCMSPILTQYCVYQLHPSFLRFFSNYVSTYNRNTISLLHTIIVWSTIPDVTNYLSDKLENNVGRVLLLTLTHLSSRPSNTNIPSKNIHFFHF